MLGQQAKPLRVVRRQERHRPSEQYSGRGVVTPHEGAPSGRRKAARAVRSDREAVIIERAEFREVHPRLLEVVAEDLLELGDAIAVHGVGPYDEPLVEVCPSALEYPVVGGVADHDVLEAVVAFVPFLDRMDQVLLRERRELGRDTR